MTKIIHLVKLIFSERYRKEYEKRMKFARIMAVNNSILKA